MPRRRSNGRSKPKYCHQKSSGQAYVTINKKRHYLGKHDTAESRERYKELLTENWEPPQAETAKSIERTDLSAVTVGELAILYGLHAKSWYRKNGKQTSEWSLVRLTLRKLRAAHGETLASEFGPLRYKAFRQTFIAAGLARRSINKYMFHVRAMFKHASNNEAGHFEWFARLKAVGNLVEGRS